MRFDDFYKGYVGLEKALRPYPIYFIDEWINTPKTYKYDKNLGYTTDKMAMNPTTNPATAPSAEDLVKRAEEAKKKEEREARIAAHYEKLNAKAEARRSHPDKLRGNDVGLAVDVLRTAQTLHDFLGGVAGKTVIRVDGSCVYFTDHETDDSYQKAHYGTKDPSDFVVARRKVYAKFTAAYTKALGELATGLEALAVETVSNKK